MSGRTCGELHKPQGREALQGAAEAMLAAASLTRKWPVPALGERKPIDIIAGGDYMRVAELVSALEEAPFS